MGFEQIRDHHPPVVEDSFGLSEDGSGIANELTDHLLGERAEELNELYPELEGPLDDFNGAFAGFVQGLLSSDIDFASDAETWKKRGEITGQLGEVDDQISNFLIAREKEEDTYHRLKRELREKEGRILRRDGPETIEEALLRLRLVTVREWFSRSDKDVLSRRDRKSLASIEKRLDVISEQINKREDNKDDLSREQKEKRWERGDFELRAIDSFAEWVADNPEHSLSFGLVFPSRIGKFLDGFYSRVRGNPRIEEVYSYLDWLIEESDAAGFLENTASWLGDTPFLTEDQALTLLVAYEQIDEQSDNYDVELRRLSEVIVGDWNTRDAQANEFRKYAQKFLRAELLDRWNEYGISVRSGKRFLSLPFVEQKVGIEEDSDLSGSPVRREQREVIIQLPDGRELVGEDFIGEDLGMTHLKRGIRDMVAGELKVLMRKLRSNPMVASSLQLPYPVKRGEEVATHRVYVTRRLRLLGSIQTDSGGTKRFIICGVGWKGSIYRGGKFKW